jgi:hypothetical protein
METQDTERYAPEDEEMPPSLNPGGDPPAEDKRNEELDESPVPDPEDGGDAEDVPEAD